MNFIGRSHFSQLSLVGIENQLRGPEAIEVWELLFVEAGGLGEVVFLGNRKVSGIYDSDRQGYAVRICIQQVFRRLALGELTTSQVGMTATC